MGLRVEFDVLEVLHDVARESTFLHGPSGVCHLAGAEIHYDTLQMSWHLP